MNNPTFLILHCLLWGLSFSSNPHVASELSISSTISYAAKQYKILAESILGEEGFISTGNPLQPTWNKKEVNNWTVGFYGGSLWMLYKLTGEESWKSLALEYQERVKERQFDTGTHDVGFVIMSTFGLGLEYADYNESIPVIIQAAKSLATRFVPVAGVIRSWNIDANHPGFPGEVSVIADNMMNIELLLVASKLSGWDPDFTEIAVSHCLKTISNHFRPDGTVYHVVAYNETTGQVERKYNHQGYADDSAWSRGLAWVIHGFATAYDISEVEASVKTTFLDYAQKAASYFINNLPEDAIPYYDFDAPNLETEYTPKDTSAAAVAAHAFFKLFRLTGNQTYFDTAESILESLVSDEYRADGKPEYQIPAIFVNGTVFVREKDTDTAIVYGDFYFLRALEAYIEITKLL